MWRLGVLVLLMAAMGCRSESTRYTSEQTSPPGQTVDLSTHPRLLPAKDKEQPTKRRKARPAPPPPPPPPRLAARSCVVPLERPGWYELANAIADRSSIRRGLARLKYRLPHPTRTYLLVTKVVPGVEQPAYYPYSLGNTGFVYSKRVYWPASTVKVWAAVGALLTLKEFGLDGSTPLRFKDRLGTFRGTAADLYDKIVNKKYDRLMRIAGAARFHNEQRRERYGYPNLVLMRAYSPLRTFRYSPRISYKKNGRWKAIPARRFRKRFRRCRTNCVTFFELQEVLRRLVLHDELPPDERFPIKRKDIEGIKKMLLKTPNKIGRAARKLWGRGVLGYNKSGSARGLDQIENVFLVKGDRRYLVSASVPWYRKHASAAPSLIILNRLGLYALRAVEAMKHQGAPLQTDAGEALKLQVSSVKGKEDRLRVEVLAPKDATVRIWHNRKPLVVKAAGRQVFAASFGAKEGAKSILVVRAMRGGKPVAHRSVRVRLPVSGSRCGEAPRERPGPRSPAE